MVDDNRVNRELLEEGITNVDAHFTGAKTVSDGIHSLKSENIDVILLDWNVGIHSGNLILEHLSSLESDTRPMVFILSPESAATIQKAVVSPVVTAIIERPISIDRGLKLVSEYIHEGGLNAYNSGNSCGAKIFDINLYEELITSGSAKEKVFELLEIFRSEIVNLLSSVRIAVEDERSTRFDSQVHAVRSVCFASGAYEMGDYFQVMKKQDGERTREMAISEKKRFIESGFRLWDVTLAHIDTYQMSLSEY